MELGKLIQEVIFYSVANSFVVFGILKTIKKALDKKKLNRFVSIIITYGLGFVMGFMVKFELILWERLMFGFFIGACSVAVYKAAIQTLLDLIPNIVGRFIKPPE